MTEGHATEIVRKIIAAPSNEAFDCAAGAIVRLFGRVIALEKRVSALERASRRRRPVDVTTEPAKWRLARCRC